MSACSYLFAFIAQYANWYPTSGSFFADRFQRWEYAFAASLLEGKVIPALKNFSSRLTANPEDLIDKRQLPQRLMLIVAELKRAQISSRQQLEERWAKEPLFLLSLSITSNGKLHYYVQKLAECSLSVFMFHCVGIHMVYFESRCKAFSKPWHPNNQFLFMYAIRIMFTGTVVDLARQHLFNCLIFKRQYYVDFIDRLNSFLMGLELSQK